MGEPPAAVQIATVLCARRVEITDISAGQIVSAFKSQAGRNQLEREKAAREDFGHGLLTKRTTMSIIKNGISIYRCKFKINDGNGAGPETTY
ncbi:hypothetical protein BELL_0119g00090 [Botrytis elliptica]|uniref:Uncharacterized protein n=1 Tax=Botrytis elliptica TaxID=278938 RepID=A0A4Z1K142_9HELO|nr:hypothetical protein BELL_0119g00090 [Botrytis elliptica]